MKEQDFEVEGLLTVSCFTKVRAKTREEAVAIAKQRQVADFHIDGSYPVDECWHFDADGVPHTIHVA
jgi:hypothetical protein